MKLFNLYKRDFRFGIIKRGFMFVMPILVAVMQTTECHRIFQYSIENDMLNTHGTIMDYIMYCMQGMFVYHFDPKTQFVIPLYWFIIQIYASYLVTYYANDDYDANAKNLFVASRGRSAWWSSKCLWCITTIIIYYAVYFISIMVLAHGFSADMSIHCTQDFVVSVFTGKAQYLNTGNIMVISILLPIIVTVGMCLTQQIFAFIVNPIASFAIMSAVYIISAYYTIWWLPGSYTMWLRSSMVAEEGIRPIIGIVLGGTMIIMSWVGGSVYFDSKDVL